MAEVPGKYARRVAFVRAGWDYTRLTLELRDLVDRYNQREKQDSAARAEADATWARIEELKATFPLAIPWRRIRRGLTGGLRYLNLGCFHIIG